METFGLSPPRPGEVTIAGVDPVHACRFPLGGLAAAAQAACGLAVSDLWELRTGRRQQVAISVRDAAASLLSFVFLRAPALPQRPGTATIALYPTGDGRWIHLHGGLPHLAEGTLRVLGCADDATAIAHAVAKREALALEEELAAARLCGAVVRSAAEWVEHPQGAALAPLPVVEVTRIGDAPPEPLGPAVRPLSGIRALDLTRVLAGPTCGRTLAEHGADVLRITSPNLPDVDAFVVDTGHGKLSASLDLDVPAEAERLRRLAAGADVFVGGYRSGSLERRGFGPEEMAALRPGIVYVSINCYGPVGPWRERAGWEQLAQCVTGLAYEQGGPGAPKLVPAAACDYTTGSLAALGALSALSRRAREGGSWHVRASLCQTGSWIRRRGSDALASAPPVSLRPDEIAGLCIESETGYGPITHLGPVLRLSETPPRWDRPSAPRGTHAAAWPPAPGAGPPDRTRTG